jgi:AraC-like DNA-binding protein
MAGYDERRPIGPLMPLVSSVWLQQVAAGGPGYRQRNVPNGCVELRCRVGSTAQVVGPLTGPLVEELPPGTTVVGLRFRPGAAAAVLGLPASELTDHVVDADELLGDTADVLAEHAADAATPSAALDAWQRRIVGRVAGAPGPDPVVAEVVRQLMPGRSGDITTVRAAMDVSERHLRRRCLTAVGLGPKTLHRMLRFQGFLALTQLALSQGRQPAGEGLAGMAAEAGYADQSHLTRECLRLTGSTPGAFVGDTTRHCGCGHDHAASFEQLLPRPVAMAGSYKRAG